MIYSVIQLTKSADVPRNAAIMILGLSALLQKTFFDSVVLLLSFFLFFIIADNS